MLSRFASWCVLQVSTAVLVLLAAGCAQIPTEEVRTYSNTFEQVRSISESLIEDFDSAQKEVKRTTDPKPQRFETTFRPQQFLAGGAPSRDIDARRAMLVAVSRYNQALLELAEGKGVESAKATAGNITSLVAVFTGPLGLAVAAVQRAAGAIESARTQGEFIRAYRMAVKDGSCPTEQAAAAGVAVPQAAPDCAALIPTIFSYLINDTAEYYKARRTLADERIRAITGSNVRIITSQIEALTGRYALPAANSTAAGEYLGLAGEYRRLTLQLILAERTFRTGAAPYDDAAHQQLVAMMAGLRQIGAQEQKVVDDLNAYYARLADYVRLLEKTSNHLDAIGVALERPADVDVLSGRIVQMGAALRRDSGDLQTAFSKLLGQ